MTNDVYLAAGTRSALGNFGGSLKDVPMTELASQVARACIDAVRERGLGTDRYEFQVLMGVRRAFAESLRDEGHPVRVYVPYGQDWHAYSLRRLAKNPDLARHVVRAALGLGR